ncbi:hypothetical protein HNR32_002348 [Pectinatus brassicae]|uniref:Uncharacterized protein n=1 Tax=Pectinatus brassicae TaxID=862415 RepID=A0A840UHI0_9FIRM|nr:hypothetical protein [Pectinatus brassicae]MBB5337191.1 hypothetical protein [Pectinatus brassicae]
MEQANFFITASQNNGLAQLMKILGWVGTCIATITGIFPLIKEVKGRRLKNIQHLDKNITVIYLEDGKDIFIC